MSDTRRERSATVGVALAANVALQLVMLACVVGGAPRLWAAGLQAASPWLAALGLWITSARLVDARSRRAWRLLAVGLSLWAVGDLGWFYLESVSGRAAYPSLADAFFVLHAVPVVAALAIFRGRRAGRPARIRQAVDHAIMFISGLLLAGVVYLYPSLDGIAGDGGAIALGVLYPLLDLLLIQGALWLLVQPAESGEPRLAMLGLVAALLCQGFADMTFAQGMAAGDWAWVAAANAAYPLAHLCYLTAARWRLRDADQVVAPSSGQMAQDLLPYLFMGLAMLALAMAPRTAPDLPPGIAGISALLVVALAALRQWLNVVEVRRLQAATESEMARRSRALSQLLVRDHLLSVVAETAERLLVGRRWHEHVNGVLAELGTACEVSRVYLMPAEVGGTQQVWTWTRESAAEPDLARAAELAGWWQPRLRAGESICGRLAEFPAEQQPVLRELGIRAMAVVPVFVSDDLWGVLGFDDLLRDREFSRAELDALKAAANVLGAAIAREGTVDQLQASEAWNRTIFEQVPAGIVVIDAETHTIADANPVALALIGAESEAVVGHVCHQFICPHAQGRCPVTDRGQCVDADERQLLTAQGAVVPVIKTVVPVELDGRRYLVESFFDNTLRKEAEDALHRAQESLEAAVADRTRELQSAYEELRATQSQVIAQERLRALGTMASGIAHDINNALSPVMGFAEIMLTDGVLDDQQRARRYLGMILSGAREAGAVVRRLRELYRQRPDGADGATVDPVQAFEHAIRLAQPRWRDQALAAGITIEVVREFDPVDPVPGHESDLHEALLNLLLNACDAIESRGGATGRIIARCRRVGGEVLLSVGDDGVGMDAEAQRLCFEPLYSTKDEPGCGLGLVAVLTIVRQHAGAIDVVSQPGQGTTVVLRLPYCQEVAPAESVAAARPDGALRVLVADDEPDLRDLLAEFLALDGHTSVLAPNGRVALALFGTEEFDLVITDRAMPELNGDQLALAVKQASPGTPVLMLTGFGALMEAGGERPEGVDQVLAKPFNLNDLREAVATAVGGGRG